MVPLRRLIRKLHYVAEARGCSTNQLVNSGLAACYSKEQTEKRGASSRATQRVTHATYDKMSPDERQQLMEVLAGLAGLQEGPKDAFPDGRAMSMTPNSKQPSKSHLLASGSRWVWWQANSSAQQSRRPTSTGALHGKDLFSVEEISSGRWKFAPLALRPCSNWNRGYIRAWTCRALRSSCPSPSDRQRHPGSR